MPEVIEIKCPQDHPCPLIRACPVNAIKQEGFDAPTIDRKLCTDCGRCVGICPYGVFVSEK